jgi:O-antigen/teichoic acid export membrane protein
MVYFDRFFIAGLLTMTAVTYYVTPFEVLSRMLYAPVAIVGVLFPALTTAFVVDRERMAEIYSQASRILLLTILPPVSVVFFFAPEGLSVWLGQDFRDASSIVVRWLSVGVIVNTLAFAPLVALQSIGRPDLVAKVHLAELIPYVGLVWFLTKEYGIAGAAVAWAGRVMVDAVLLHLLAKRTVPEISRIVSRFLVVLPAVFVVFGVFAVLHQEHLRIIVSLCIWCICGYNLVSDVRRLSPCHIADR